MFGTLLAFFLFFCAFLKKKTILAPLFQLSHNSRNHIFFVLRTPSKKKFPVQGLKVEFQHFNFFPPFAGKGLLLIVLTFCFPSRLSELPVLSSLYQNRFCLSFCPKSTKFDTKRPPSNMPLELRLSFDFGSSAPVFMQSVAV